MVCYPARMASCFSSRCRRGKISPTCGTRRCPLQRRGTIRRRWLPGRKRTRPLSILPGTSARSCTGRLRTDLDTNRGRSCHTKKHVAAVFGGSDNGVLGYEAAQFSSGVLQSRGDYVQGWSEVPCASGTGVSTWCDNTSSVPSSVIQGVTGGTDQISGGCSLC